MMNKYSKRLRGGVTLIAVLLTTSVLAASGDTLDQESDKALQVFRDDIPGAEIFIQQAAGYLVFPRVIKIGVGVGAETGEGVLRVGGQTVAYYRTTSGSIGLQLGAQAKSIVIAFMTKQSLQKFRNSNGWKVGVDGSIALIDHGGGKTIDSDNVRGPGRRIYFWFQGADVQPDTRRVEILEAR